MLDATIELFSDIARSVMYPVDWEAITPGLLAALEGNDDD